MNKYERGTSLEYTSSIMGVDISSLSWKDNKIVNLVSTYVGLKPCYDPDAPDSGEAIGTAKRFDKKEKRIIEIPCPQIIKEYNKHMGGVDLMDSFLGRHKIIMKSRKWTNRVFYHLLDVVMVNAWILYNRANKDKPEFRHLKQSEFRREIADVLCNLNSNKNGKFYLYICNTLNAYEKFRTGKRAPGRPIVTEIDRKRNKPNAAPAPAADVRTDQTGHWPSYGSNEDKRKRCKMPNCIGVTQNMCVKCGVNLCFTKEKNCFFLYHNQ